MILTVISIIITVLFFLIILLLVMKDLTLIESVGLSFLYGVGVETVIFFLIFSVNDHVSVFTFWCIKLVQLVFVLLLSMMFWGKFKIIFISQKFELALIPFLCWTVILLMFLLSLIYTLYMPVHTTDSLYYFDFRSKIMFLSGTVSQISIIPNWSFYPMFTSMIGLMSRLSGYENPSFYYPLIYLSFSLVFYSFLKRRMNTNFASLFTLLMYSTPILYWQSRLDGMVNMPYSVYLSAGMIYSIQYFSRLRQSKFIFFMAIIGLGLSRWIRIQEPFWMIPLIAVLLKILYEKKWMLVTIGIILFLLITSVWPSYIIKTYETMNGKDTSIKVVSALQTIMVSTNQSDKSVSDKLVKLVNNYIVVAKGVLKNLIISLSPVSYLFLLVVILIIVFRVNVEVYISLFFIISACLLLTISAFYSTFVWGSMMTELESSLSRLVGFLVPPMWYFVSISLVLVLPKKYTK